MRDNLPEQIADEVEPGEPDKVAENYNFINDSRLVHCGPTNVTEDWTVLYYGALFKFISLELYFSSFLLY